MFACDSSRCCSRPPWVVERGRPSLPARLSDLFNSLESASSVGIVSCGPVTLTNDVRNAVAAQQWMIATGRAAEGVAEVQLHTEEFDW